MVKRGPKPKDPMAEFDKAMAPAMMRRIIDQAKMGARDPNLATPIGRMQMVGRITLAQFAAGVKLHTLRALTDLALDLPPRHTPAIDYNRAGGRALLDQTDEGWKSRAVKAYDDAITAIGPYSRRLSAVEAVVIYEMQPVSWEQVMDVRDGLDALAWHFGKQGKAKE